MPEYSLAFAGDLAKTASSLAANGLSDPEAKRTVLYLSLLSTEISLKAMLEQAGVPVAKIRKRSHDLSGLVRDLGKCKVEVEVAAGKRMLAPATRLRACALEYKTAKPTVGQIIDAEREGASQYPNQVRYGKLPRHFPPEVVAQMATKVHRFAREHWQSICAP